MSSPRFYIWPRYALEIDGNRIVFPPRPGAALARLFAARGKYVSMSEIIEAVYSGDEDGGPLKAANCIRATMCRSRRLLKRFGLSIENLLGRESHGYRLTGHYEPPRDIKPLVRKYIDPVAEVDSCSVGQFLDKFDDGRNSPKWGYRHDSFLD